MQNFFCKNYLIFMKIRARGSNIATPVHTKSLSEAQFADCRARESGKMTPVHGNANSESGRLRLDAESFTYHVN